MAFFGSSWKQDSDEDWGLFSRYKKDEEESPCKDHFIQGWNSAINHVISYLADKRGHIEEIRDIKKFLK